MHIVCTCICYTFMQLRYIQVVPIPVEHGLEKSGESISNSVYSVQSKELINE